PFTIEKLDDFGTVAGSDSDTQPDDQEFMPAEFFGEAAAAQEQDEFDLPIPNGDAVVEPLSQDGVEQDDAGQDDTAGDFLFFGDDDEESAPAFEPDPLEHSAFTIGFEDTEEQTDALDELAGPPPLPGSLASAAQLAAEDDDEDARRLSELEEWFTSEDAEQGKLPDWIAEAAATAQGSTAAPWSAPPEPAAAPTGAPSGDAAPPLEPPKNRKPKRSSAERARSRRLRTLTFVVIGLFLLAAFIGWLTFLRPDPGAQPAEPEVATIPAPETQPTPAPAEPAPPTYDAAGVGDVVFVVASRPTEDQARDFADNLSGSGLPVTIAPATLSNGEVWYRVMLGVYGSPEDAEASRPELPSPVRGEAWVLEL
ncbi:MAG: SPOR domain-containing protein, partial [Bacteroidota bacterium]